MELLKEKYDFYIKHVPRSTSTLFSHSSSELDSIRKNIIKSHRIIAMSSLLENDKKENRCKYGLSKSITSTKKFVLNPIVLDATVNVSPVLVHQTATLFNLIHFNTSTLVDALLSYKKSIPAFSSFSLVDFNDRVHTDFSLSKTSSSGISSSALKEFNYLTLSAIPSLFGFYSSNEHINLSMGFFVKLFNSTDCLPLILPVLKPFFTAPCLFRFFESSLSPFFDSLLRDTQEFTETVIKHYSEKITESCASSAPLVPHTHVVLLRMMHAKFGENATCYFFFEILLKSQIFQWVETISTSEPKKFALSPNSKSKFKAKSKSKNMNDQIIKEIIESAFKNIDQSKILHKILNSESLIEVPFQYTVFEDPFLYFLVSISDIRALYHLFIKESDKTLNSMKIIDSEPVDENAVFWVKTYPQHQMETQLTRVPLIFESYEFKAPEDEVKERQWRAIENLAEEREVDPMQIVHEINEKKRNGKESAEEIDEFTNYALSMALESSIESSNVFEQFLMQMFNLDSSKKWQKISSLYEYIIMMPIVKAMVIKKERKINQSNFDLNNFKSFYTNLFIKSSENLLSPTIKKYQYLFIIQRVAPKVLKGSESDFNAIKEKFGENFQQKLDNSNSIYSQLDIKDSQIPVYWEAMSILISITNSSDLPFQFTNLMRGLALLYNISGLNCSQSEEMNNDENDERTEITKKFLNNAFVVNTAENFLEIYMIISLFCMSDDQFRSLCTEQEHRLWVIFQNVILSFICESQEASEKYTAIISRFNRD